MRTSTVLVISLVLALAASETISLAHAEYATISLRPMSRYLMYRSVFRSMGCIANSRLCNAPGSPGGDCCRNTCVNILNDGHNCGMCGKKCKYPEACCGGKCVDLLHNRYHCGMCNNKCREGVSCSQGMCGYA